jgi:imidazolonepropionase-like amidohydrolase
MNQAVGMACLDGGDLGVTEATMRMTTNGPGRWIACAALAICAGTAVAADDTPTTVLRAAKVLVGPDAAPIDDGVVLMRGGRIVAVGRQGSVAVPGGALESSCGRGGVVAAGFQNSHVHFIEPAMRDAARQPAAALALHLSAMLTRYGFTTVVDTGSERANTLALRARIERGELTGPRILTAGQPLFPPDGLPFYVAGLPKTLLDSWPQPPTPEAAVKAVRENLDAGADGTKLFVATPQANRTVRHMPPAIVQAAANASHERGKLVMAHPTDADGLRAALAARVDIVVHTTLDGGMTWPAPLVKQMVDARMAVVPTLKLWRYELIKENVPEGVQRTLVAAALGQLKDFSSAGGDVLFGTDVGYMTDHDPTGEYELMAQAGMTPMQILASLTTAPAARWNEAARRGRVAVGMDADLVVLEADPAQDAKNFAKLRCTIRGGAVVFRK